MTRSAFLSPTLPSSRVAAKRPVWTCSLKPTTCDCGECDGYGRVVGGLGAVLPWWPIKAYRPCQNFLRKQGQYARKGQSLDEIAFGRKPADDLLDQRLDQRLKGK